MMAVLFKEGCVSVEKEVNCSRRDQAVAVVAASQVCCRLLARVFGEKVSCDKTRRKAETCAAQECLISLGSVTSADTRCPIVLAVSLWCTCLTCLSVYLCLLNQSQCFLPSALLASSLACAWLGRPACLPATRHYVATKHCPLAAKVRGSRQPSFPRFRVRP